MLEDMIPSRKLVERTRGRSVVLQLEKVRCGRSICRSCPHGPYWYAYWSEGGRTRSAYVGKDVRRAGWLAQTIRGSGGRVSVRRRDEGEG